MLRRITVLSFLLMYLGTTVGFAMSVHFCGTNISDIRINKNSEKPCCAKETENKTDNCCNDKQIKIKVSDQQRSIQSAKIPAAVNLDLFVLSEELTNSFFGTFISLSRSIYRGPPVLSNIPLTVQNCNFRI